MILEFSLGVACIVLLVLILIGRRADRVTPFADRDALLALATRRYKTVRVAGMKVRLQSLLEEEKASLESAVLTGGAIAGDKLAQARQRLLAMSAVDDRGHLLFSVEDLEKLGRIDSRAMAELCREVEDFVGFEPQDISSLVDLAKQLSELQQMMPATKPTQHRTTRPSMAAELRAAKRMFPDG